MTFEESFKSFSKWLYALWKYFTDKDYAEAYRQDYAQTPLEKAVEKHEERIIALPPPDYSQPSGTGMFTGSTSPYAQKEPSPEGTRRPPDYIGDQVIPTTQPTQTPKTPDQALRSTAPTSTPTSTALRPDQVVRTPLPQGTDTLMSGSQPPIDVRTKIDTIARLHNGKRHVYTIQATGQYVANEGAWWFPSLNDAHAFASDVNAQTGYANPSFTTYNNELGGYVAYISDLPPIVGR